MKYAFEFLGIIIRSSLNELRDFKSLIEMKKIISLILLLIATLSLISCSCKLHDSLDGEYYWISSERNELAFTIKGDKGTIEHGEADYFTINKENAH